MAGNIKELEKKIKDLEIVVKRQEYLFSTLLCLLDNAKLKISGRIVLKDDSELSLEDFLHEIYEQEEGDEDDSKN